MPCVFLTFLLSHVTSYATVIPILPLQVFVLKTLLLQLLNFLFLDQVRCAFLLDFLGFCFFHLFSRSSLSASCPWQMQNLAFHILIPVTWKRSIQGRALADLLLAPSSSWIISLSHGGDGRQDQERAFRMRARFMKEPE